MQRTASLSPGAASCRSPARTRTLATTKSQSAHFETGACSWRSPCQRTPCSATSTWSPASTTGRGPRGVAVRASSGRRDSRSSKRFEHGHPSGGSTRTKPGLRTWIEIIGGALGIAVAAATFYFLLWPRPDACVRQLVGQLGPPIVDRGVTYGEYLKRIGEPPGNADPKTLKRVGNILDFRITVVGYRGKRLPVRWSTLTEGGRPLNAPQLTNQLAFEVEPDDCSDSGRRLTWTPLPQRAGSYINEINLIDDNGERLDTRRTAPFDIPLP